MAGKDSWFIESICFKNRDFNSLKCSQSFFIKKNWLWKDHFASFGDFCKIGAKNFWLVSSSRVFHKIEIAIFNKFRKSIHCNKIEELEKIYLYDDISPIPFMHWKNLNFPNSKWDFSNSKTSAWKKNFLSEIWVIYEFPIYFSFNQIKFILLLIKRAQFLWNPRDFKIGNEWDCFNLDKMNDCLILCQWTTQSWRNFTPKFWELNLCKFE